MRTSSDLHSAFLGLVLLIAAAGVADAAMIAVPGDPVQTTEGPVAGTKLHAGVKAYLGIPFAAPPVRGSRWRAPQPPKPWAGVYNADTLRPECPQGLRSPSINHYFGEEPVSEDCLYLNIWEPADAKAGDRRPVVVWIYGGGFNVGSASSPIYSGENLARKGVIYVAPNYRLGVFGFLAHPELTAESGRNASGNWGFLDQVAALQWVKRNVASFGGDPDNVTLVGQSAGSMSINNLQASPLARGLFAKAFGMSGSTVNGGPADARGTSLAEGEATGLKLQEAMKAEHIDQLRGTSWDKVLAAAQQARLRFGPIIDGYYLPDTPQHIFEAGRQSDVPVVAGSTANDIGTNVPIRSAKSLPEYRTLAQESYGARASELFKLWPAKDDQGAIREADQIGRNSGFTLAAWNWVRMQALTGRQPSYMFMVTRVQPFAPGVKFSDFDPSSAGAYHMGDVPYFLGTYDAFNMFRTTRNWTDYDRALSEKMQDVIVAFARTGNPNTPGVKFVRFNPKDPERTVFGNTVTLERLNQRGMDFLLSNPVQQQPQQPNRPRQTF